LLRLKAYCNGDKLAVAGACCNGVVNE
jgi:hypothetical protein